jgi:WD40 repeat protein
VVETEEPPVVALTTPQMRLRGHESWVQVVAFSPSGGYLVSMDALGWLIAWDPET